MRLTVIDAGLPQPEVNYDVIEAGRWLGQVDLAYPELRIAIEYEGEHHLTDPLQWAEDIARATPAPPAPRHHADGEHGHTGIHPSLAST